MSNMRNKNYAVIIASMLAVLNALEAALEEAQNDILNELVASWGSSLNGHDGAPSADSSIRAFPLNLSGSHETHILN